MLLSSLDLAGAKASGANSGLERLALNQDGNLLDIGFPSPVSPYMRMAVLFAKSNTLAAD
jgi:hypothetical protein